MRHIVLAAPTAALILSTAPLAHAYEVVIGGFAGQCSAAAKDDRSDDEAIRVCDWALLRDVLSQRDRAGTHVNRGSMMLRSDRWEEARADFETALALQPKMGEAHVGQGAWLLRQQRFAEAESAIDRGIALGTEQPEKAYYLRGWARWGQDEFQDAYLDFRKASQLKPTWSLPREQMANFIVERRN